MQQMNGKSAYASLAWQTMLGGVAMYLSMFVMIDRLGSFYNNLNMFYMTLMMVSPMVALMIVFMSGIFASKRANLLLLVGSATDNSSVRSSPHHSGAILICEQATLMDPRLVALCRNIFVSQRAEIGEMKAMLAR